MGSRHRPGTALGPADDRPSTLRAPAGDPTPITQVKVRTRAKSITGFSLAKPVTGSRLTSLILSTTNASGANLYFLHNCLQGKDDNIMIKIMS